MNMRRLSSFRNLLGRVDALVLMEENRLCLIVHGSNEHEENDESLLEKDFFRDILEDGLR